MRAFVLIFTISSRIFYQGMTKRFNTLYNLLYILISFRVKFVRIIWLCSRSLYRIRWISFCFAKSTEVLGCLRQIPSSILIDFHILVMIKVLSQVSYLSSIIFFLYPSTFCLIQCWILATTSCGALFCISWIYTKQLSSSWIIWSLSEYLLIILIE